MKFIKEVYTHPDTGRYIVFIYSDHYGKGMDYILRLRDQLRMDIPHLLDADELMEINLWGGDYKKGVLFVRAYLPATTTVPDSYQRISYIDPVL